MSERTGSPAIPKLVYTAPSSGLVPEKRLVAVSGSDEGYSCVFYQDLQIGRLNTKALLLPGTLCIADQTVSTKHCMLTQDAYGRCFVRDTSRNGTWIDGRRLVPGTEVEFRVGQRLSIGQGHVFQLDGESVSAQELVTRATREVFAPLEVTVLIGDIRGYTTLVVDVSNEELQRCVRELFRRLEQMVLADGGTIKEYAGDALMAYWEHGPTDNCAVRACRAALALDRASRELASDPLVWSITTHPLRLEWALASGTVLIQTLGGAHPTGLSMIGEPVIKAYRLEKLADDVSGTILACDQTRSLAGTRFGFADRGEKRLDGFAAPERVHALLMPL